MGAKQRTQIVGVTEVEVLQLAARARNKDEKAFLKSLRLIDEGQLTTDILLAAMIFLEFLEEPDFMAIAALLRDYLAQARCGQVELPSGGRRSLIAQTILVEKGFLAFVAGAHPEGKNCYQAAQRDEDYR